MKRASLFCAFVVSLATTGCGDTSSINEATARPPDAAEAHVIGDLIYEFFSRDEAVSDDVLFLVGADTLHNAGVSEHERHAERNEKEYFREWMVKHGLIQSTIDAYATNNRRSWRLPDDFRPPVRYEMREGAIDRSTFPGRSMVVNVSRAGIDETGNLIFAKKIEGIWRIVADQCLIST